MKQVLCTVCDGGLMFDLNVETSIHLHNLLSQLLESNLAWPHVTYVQSKILVKEIIVF